ncbi:MAG TPA: hypothetical protein VHF22_14435, partial [Planctomycetota bacterium]|nr:hypothetical protein [Planctomycetota bacterium]
PQAPRPRCTNCGDETRFNENVDPERERKGWCVACWRQAERLYGVRTLYARNRFAGTIHGPRTED